MPRERAGSDRAAPNALWRGDAESTACSDVLIVRMDRRSSPREALAVLSLARKQSADVAAMELPAGELVVWSDELSVGECRLDAPPNLRLARRLYGEQDPQVEVCAHPCRARMMRRQRARRLVVPVSAQRHRDSCSGRPRVGIALHGQDCVVGEGIAHDLSLTLARPHHGRQQQRQGRRRRVGAPVLSARSVESVRHRADQPDAPRRGLDRELGPSNKVSSRQGVPGARGIDCDD